MPRRAWSEEEKQVNVYNWDTYIGETTNADFTAATGIEVRYDLYANNDDLYGKLKAGNPGYDVIFPSDYMIQTLIEEGKLMPLDRAKLTNWNNIDERFRDPPFDPGLKYSVPYMWGTIGIGFRKSKVDPAPDSWGALFDSDRHAGRIALLADSREVLGLVLKYLGYPMNDTDPAHVAQARDLLIKQRPHIKAFAPDEGQNMLAAGDVDVVMEWNGDILSLMGEDEDVGFVVPKEGTMLWQDGICIPTGAPHPDNAHLFIDHILDAQVNAEIAQFINYATGNAAAQKLLPPEMLQDPAVYPPPEVVEKSERLQTLGEAERQMYDEAWTAVTR
jgi:spermidine/putrescine transport system substrate-binding protein